MTKLTQLKVKVFSSASVAGLESDITAFLRAGGEATLVQAEYAIAAGPIYSAIILYAN
jgi:hypothetical protein